MTTCLLGQHPPMLPILHPSEEPHQLPVQRGLGRRDGASGGQRQGLWILSGAG